MNAKALLFTLLLAAASLTTNAEYTDHRGRKVDSLLHVLKSGKPLSDETLAGIYKDLMWGLLQNDGKQATEYAQRLVRLSYRHDWLNSRADALRILGLHAYGNGHYEEAERYFMQALAVTDSMQHSGRYDASAIDDNYSTLYGSLGNLYNIQDKNLLAIEYYQRALPIFEKYGWKESQTILYHNVAELYTMMGNQDKARENFLKAIRTGQQTGDSLMTALPRKGLAKVYLDEDDYEHAKETLQKAYDYYHNHQEEEAGDYSTVLVGLTRLHLMKGHQRLDLAQRYAQEALQFTGKELMSDNLYDIYAAATQVEMQLGRWHEALQYARQSIHPNDDEATQSDVGCYEILANIYMQLGQKDSASLYINKVRAMLERFATSHFQSGLSQMEVLYETRQKEAAIQKLTQQKHWYMAMTLLVALLLLTTTVSFILYWRSNQLKKRHALTLAKLEGEQAERVRIARDLHDRLGGLLTAIKLEHPSPLADEAIREMRNVAHHLLPDALSRYGLRTALRDYCLTMRNVSFEFVGDERHVSHEETVYCIVYELVNNAVKSAQAHNISVELLIDESRTAVSVRDDGRGFDTSRTNGEGSGINHIRERIAAIGGTISIHSEPQKGTEINIELPTTP